MDSEPIAEPVIGPRVARTRRRCPGMTTWLRRAPRRTGDHGQYLVGGLVRCLFLPAHRAERPFQHAADAHRVGPDVKRDRFLMQLALRLGRAIALAQIIEPGRAMIALG